MERLPGATALARSLLSLSRSQATGVLRIDAADRQARVSIVDGTPRAIATAFAADDLLGDLLVRSGSVDPRAHAEALSDGGPDGPVGEWLVSTGLAEKSAVAHALRIQLRGRMVRLFGWGSLRLTFDPGSADVGVALVDEPLPTRDLVLAAMREVVRSESLIAIRKRLGDAPLVLTPLGQELLASAALYPEEAAMLPVLRRGAEPAAILAVGAESPRAHRMLFALRMLHAVAPPPPAASFRRLLEKHRQVRRSASSQQLLELASGARGDRARRAFRRLAGELHPDRFESAADPAVRKISSEVMQALVRAEADLRRR